MDNVCAAVMTTQAPVGAQEPDLLNELLVAEQHIAAKLAEARSESARRIADARRVAASLAESALLRVADAQRELEQRLQLEADGELGRIRSTAQADVARYDSVPADELAQIALDWLLKNEHPP